MKKPSLSIAYNMQKRSGKKMAAGGLIKGAEADGNPGTPPKKPDNMRPEGYMNSDARSSAMPSGYPTDAESIVDAIRSKQRAEIMMANGGEVPHGETDNEESGQAPYDNFNADAFGPVYDDDQLSAQPMDGDEIGDEDESPRAPAEMKLVDRIRERMKTRRGF